ncbi:MAG: hypothetical protein WC477_06445 [Patescibacteria group bacterium]
MDQSDLRCRLAIFSSPFTKIRRSRLQRTKTTSQKLWHGIRGAVNSLKKMKQTLNKKYLFCFLPLLLAVVLLWQLLLPGYILTLDMGFVPHIPRPMLAAGAIASGLPHAWVWYMLGLFLSGWIVQKIILLILFIGLPVIAYHFLLPKNFSRTARLWVALFYTINPFVYTRFLAGQWGILYAYALAPLVVSFILELIPSFQEGARSEERGARRNLEITFSRFSLLASRISLPVSLALVCIFSLHIGAMLLLAMAGVYIWRFVALKGSRVKICLEGAIQAGILAVLTAYWTIPALLNRQAMTVGTFGSKDWNAFQTAAHPVIGTLGNVLTLYGFWGEQNPWAKQFIFLNHSWHLIAIISGCLIGVLIVIGCIALFRDRTTRSRGFFLLVVLIASIIFSCGVGTGIFQSFNLWLFEHIPFWIGFRDSQKWSALIVICYSIFAGTGLNYLSDNPAIKQFNNLTIHLSTMFISCVAILIYTFPMLLGFSGQLQPSWYPASWDKVDTILKQDSNCKAIFLPWHMYYSSTHANGILISNSAKSYFHCSVLTSQDVELGDIRTQGAINPAYDAISGVVTGSDHWTPEQGIDLLKNAGIRYVIDAKDMSEPDQFDYQFLKAKGIQSKDFGDVTLFQL